MKKLFVYGFASMLLVPSFALAQTASTTPGVNPAQTKRICAASAVEKRDSSIITLHNSFNTAIVSALTARKDSLKAGYLLEQKDAGQSARKAAWKKFKTDAQAAHNTLRSARKMSWATFNSDMRACGIGHDETPNAVLSPSVSL